MAKEAQNESLKLGRYRLLSLLGRGGTARVYRAVRPGPMGFEKEVALKVIDRQTPMDEEAAMSLVNEARLGCLLKHPNIVTIDEFDRVDETFYIAMEFIDGWALDRLLVAQKNTGRKLPLSVGLEIVLAVCTGLHYAHGMKNRDGKRLNIVHRDLKPGNVMISRSGAVKIADFGTAKAATNIKNTKLGFTRGTPAYMSPEQVAGEPLDHRSDLFSMGSMIYELATLEMMFEADNMVTVMHKVLAVNLEDKLDKLEGAAASLCSVISRCVQLSTNERFDSAADLADALTAVSSELPSGPTVKEWIDSLGSDLPLVGGATLGPDSMEAPSHNWETDADTLQAPAGGPTPLPSVALELISEPGTSSRDASGPPPWTRPRSSPKPPPRANLGPPRRVRAPAPPRAPEKNSILGPLLRLTLGLALLAEVAILSAPLLPGSGGPLLDRLHQDQVQTLTQLGLPIGWLNAPSGAQGPAKLLNIPGAKLLLGSASDQDASPTPKPIEVPSFLMFSHEVTVDEYRANCPKRWWQPACSGWKDPGPDAPGDHPVTGVTWSQAKTYCEALDLRLPTEAEWELAARGSTGRKHPWGNEWTARAANYCDIGCVERVLAVTYENDGFSRTAPVGSFPRGSTPEKVLDLAGNVSEWTLDCWIPGHQDRKTWHARTSNSCSKRVVRGGSWRDSSLAQVTWQRAGVEPELHSSRTGFRCASGKSPVASP